MTASITLAVDCPDCRVPLTLVATMSTSVLRNQLGDREVLVHMEQIDREAAYAHLDKHDADRRAAEVP